MVNLKLMGWIDNDLSALPEYTRVVSESTEVPIPINYPVVGRDAFRTGTGVHAAAVIKAYKKGDAWLADRVYSGVPASMASRCATIRASARRWWRASTTSAIAWSALPPSRSRTRW